MFVVPCDLGTCLAAAERLRGWVRDEVQCFFLRFPKQNLGSADGGLGGVAGGFGGHLELWVYSAKDGNACVGVKQNMHEPCLPRALSRCF